MPKKRNIEIQEYNLLDSLLFDCHKLCISCKKEIENGLFKSITGIQLFPRIPRTS